MADHPTRTRKSSAPKPGAPEPDAPKPEDATNADTGRALVTTPVEETECDAHGFDPAEYDWIPVKRQRRPDGWSHAKQRAFIETLADTGSVTAAAFQVGVSASGCYKLRRSPGAEPFARAWDAAIQEASKRLVEVAFERALNGVEDIVFDKNGNRIACRQRYNDRLLMFLLRAHQPERYRHAAFGGRAADDLPAPVLPPVADALVALAPVDPPDPHLLMSPEDLENALDIADMLEGELPHWQRDPDPHAEPFVDHALEAKLDAALGRSPRMDEDDLADEDPF